MTLTASWQSPSNIALVKYWGKHGTQLPRNPSLSFTLSSCVTRMQVTVDPAGPAGELDVRYDGTPRPAFEGKIRTFFRLLDAHFPWLDDASVAIDSVNTFPHGAGIASSASAMSALALCLTEIHDKISGTQDTGDADWWLRVSGVARLGSGSACRSVFPGAALWGATDGIAGSSDDFAIPWAGNMDAIYREFRDTILIVSSAEKSVSSTAGHALMDSLPYAPVRYAEARQNLARLVDAMSRRDGLVDFMAICESEALQLHALMMSGSTPFILMEPGTLAIIKAVWRFRRDTGIPVCFTLDAGPNVHLLYPAEVEHRVMSFVRDELVAHCSDGRFIEDGVGKGPVRF